MSETKDDSYPSAATGWAMVAVLFTLYIISVTDRYILSFVVAPLKKDLGASDFEISLLSTALFVFYAACALPIGYMLDRFSRRGVIFGGVFLWSIAATASGLVRGFTSLLGMRAVVGAGEATLLPGTYSILADMFRPSRLALAIGVFVMGGTTGIGLSYLIGGPLVQALTAHGPMAFPILGTLQPWQMAFIITGFPGLFLAFLIYFLPEPKRRKSPEAKPGAFGEAFRYMAKRPYFYLSHFLSFALLQGAMGASQFWLPAFFGRAHGWTPTEIGVTLGIIQIVTATAGLWGHGMIVERLFGGGMKNAHFRWQALMSSISLPLAAAAFLVSGWQTALVLLCCYYTLAICASSFGPASLQIATPSALRGRISSIYMLIVALTSAITPSIPPFISDHLFQDEQKLGLAMAITVGGLLAISAILLITGSRTAKEAVLDIERG